MFERYIKAQYLKDKAEALSGPKFEAFVSKADLSGRKGILNGSRYVVTREGKRLFINKNTIFVDEIVGSSASYVPAAAVVEATNGTFNGLTSGKVRAVIGREWMTLAADVMLEECRGASVRYNKVKAGSKIRLIEHGNVTVPARVAIILPE
jgi:hypothetical protein